MKRERSRKQGQRPPAAGRPSGSPAVPAARLSPRRKWLFRFLAAVVLPLIILGGLELLLRLMGFGFDPHFFRRTTIGGKDCYVANQDFGLRFFPRSMVRTPPPVVPGTLPVHAPARVLYHPNSWQGCSGGVLFFHPDSIRMDSAPAGEDFLQLKSPRDQQTFWQPARPDSSFDRMF